MNYETVDVNQTTLRGSKYAEYTNKEPVDRKYYDGEIWNPSVNGKIVGKYIDCLENVGRYKQKMYIIDSDRLDNKFDKIFGCTSLDRQMKKIEKSTVIEIEYLGKNDAKNYHEYRISRLRKQQ